MALISCIAKMMLARSIDGTILLFLLSIALSATSARAGNTLSSTEMARLNIIAKSQVHWDMKSVVTADVTCSGRPSQVVIGYGKGKVFVGVLPPADDTKIRQPAVFEFAVSAGVQEAVCRTPVHIETYPISCFDDEYGPLEGCRQIKGCRAFAAADNACDPIEFYWNNKAKRLEWYRY